jgi:LysR family transcriptional regulator, glycine cleavage system transcriptional activator
MTRRLPPLVALRAFEAVARLGSVRKAAHELGVDHSAVSRHVHNLEAFLGVRLIDNSPRGSEPTPDGRRYFEQAALAFEVIAQATEALKPAGTRGELNFWCVPGLAVRWLMPRLGALERLLPGLDIVLRPTDQPPDLTRGEADVELRFNPRPATGVRYEQLLAPRFFPVASPAFLAAHGPVTSVEDLAQRPLIHEESREQWRRWLAQAGLDPVPPLTGPRLWYANVAIEAALMGQGVTLVNRLQVADELTSGRLMELLHTDIRLGAYVVQTSAERWGEAAFVKLRRWLAEQMIVGGDI